MRTKRRTKIVATVGPAIQSSEMLEKLARIGVNVFRLNFSHGNHDSHLENIRKIKQIREKLNLPVAILQDLSGPKIRIGKISPEPLQLKTNDKLIFDSSLEGANLENKIGVNYKNFASDVFPGAKLLLADGALEVVVEQVQQTRVYCKVLNGGQLTSAKGINFPTGSFKVPSFTEKDRVDLAFGLKNEVDLVALSFVRSPDDVEKVRSVMKREGRVVPIVAKIEKHEAINNIEEIVEAADAIMIARGDLGVEVDIEYVPVLQKQILILANKKGKPVITATQMLRSMVNSPRPTRAEVTDVANAIMDGTDAIMLSEETAVGEYPVAAVNMMNKIAVQAENYFLNTKIPVRRVDISDSSLTASIAHSAVILSRDIDARLIFAITRTGYTAKAIARYRPKSKIFAFTPGRDSYYQLAIVWGVIPEIGALTNDPEELFSNAFAMAGKQQLLKKNDPYIIVSGFPLGKPGTINQIKAGRFS